jgi:hypothetical protein
MSSAPARAPGDEQRATRPAAGLLLCRWDGYGCWLRVLDGVSGGRLIERRRPAAEEPEGLFVA